MELIGVIVAVCVIGWIWSAAFASGKRLGSRKAYGVGFDRGRRSRGRSGCFIATEVYGRDDHPVVAVLRQYRDGTLRRSAAGRFFTRFYYQAGPSVARFVHRCPNLRRPCRWVLTRWAWHRRSRWQSGCIPPYRRGILIVARKR